MSLPDPYIVPQHRRNSAFEAVVPGSKSLTNRAVIAASLCREPVTLLRPLVSEDTDVASQALSELGVQFKKGQDQWIVDASNWHDGNLEKIPDLYLANAGTAVRFLSAVFAAKSMSCRIHGSKRMHERPIDLLIQGLSDLGANIRSEKDNGCPPLLIEQSSLKGGHTVLSGQVSSQFFSGLMMAAPLAESQTVIEVSDEWLSKPYIEMTASMLKDFGIRVEVGQKAITIAGGQTYQSPGVYAIEPDASAATYPLGLAVLHGVAITLKGLGSDSLQGDVKFCEVLEAMGCEVHLKAKEIYVNPPQQLKAIEMDLNELPDAAMTVVVLCAVANGSSHLWGLKNLAFKECDRLKALETELQKVGAKVQAYEDGFKIEGCSIVNLHGAEIETYKDHRMAMCLGILGTLVKDMKIGDPGCVSKTYPTFWDDLNTWLK